MLELLAAPELPVLPVPVDDPVAPVVPVAPVAPVAPVGPALPAVPAGSGAPMLPVVAPLDMLVLGEGDDDVPLPVLPEPDAPDWSVPLCLLQPATVKATTATAIATRRIS